MSFYSHIETDNIPLYQVYINHVFAISPSLEFDEEDSRLKRLTAKAVRENSLDELDLELMRMQYVCADKRLREKFRGNWAARVINRKRNDFFPSPWTILAGVFGRKN